MGVATGDAVAGRAERVRLAVRERLPMWVQLRCGLEARTLAALSVVLVAAGLLAAQHFWAARPQSVRAPRMVSAEAAVPDARGPAALDPDAVGPDPLPGRSPEGGGERAAADAVVVDVSGKVRRPGVLRLPSGSRVTDALRAAGGVEPGADITGLNRARVLMDGEQVVVGGPPPPGAGAGGAGAGAGPGATGGGRGAGPVSLNSGTVDQFDTLPGVGPVLAQHIVGYRTEHGGFRSVEELREVNGIGERRFADLQPLVRP
ncbi:helix-hairpin-helix domain-containing protein [Streptomyces sp. NPDC051569]|uniref:helix-hairpin-helix domain-containing protein n=1 Tax=Streptomyces sp. NPDC051569 TaxID=3365661 RepID=UPI0037A8082A